MNVAKCQTVDTHTPELGPPYPSPLFKEVPRGLLKCECVGPVKTHGRSHLGRLTRFPGLNATGIQYDMNTEPIPWAARLLHFIFHPKVLIAVLLSHGAVFLPCIYISPDSAGIQSILLHLIQTTISTSSIKLTFRYTIAGHDRPEAATVKRTRNYRDIEGECQRVRIGARDHL